MYGKSRHFEYRAETADLFINDQAKLTLGEKIGSNPITFLTIGELKRFWQKTEKIDGLLSDKETTVYLQLTVSSC
ncbi:hypothetical protein VIBNISOn1_p0055 [Vibrio nigripulchritudo SOn1]|uniref:Integrase n=1 Tax=Vibrio nigripulchritudo SOn1 TaxID=1238450 RepID=A0AAV2W1K1_9VIBR|nr:hypothetical protein VIBNISOn1_p0055 [Vibrio nigripulchritudo SOn1]